MERSPVYYRWSDERSPLLVELKIDLVPRILADLQAAEQLGLEGGGVLIGSFPQTIGPPVLRIEDFETVARRGGDGLPYILLAEQRQRFTAVRKRVATRELSAVGFFRSHLRSGPFDLALSDRDLMSAEFKNAIHVALLIGSDYSSTTVSEGRHHLATYFVSVNGIVRNGIDPATMPFDVAEMEKLSASQTKLLAVAPPVVARPQADEGAIGGQSAAPHAPDPAVLPRSTAKGVRRAAWMGVGAIALLSLLFVVWGWQRQGSRFTAEIFAGSTPDLAVTVAKETGLPNHRQALEIRWSYRSSSAWDAASARLSITNKRTHQTIRELALEPSDLALGYVRAEMDEQPAEVSLAVLLSNGKLVTANGATTN